MTTTTAMPASASPETVVPVVGEYLVRTHDGSCAAVRVAGTPFSVSEIFDWVERQGLTPAQVVAAHPELSRAAVHAALAYGWSRPDEIPAAPAPHTQTR